MKHAIFGDVHGNLEGLEAVLADAKAAEPKEVIACRVAEFDFGAAGAIALRECLVRSVRLA